MAVQKYDTVPGRNKTVNSGRPTKKSKPTRRGKK